MREDDVHGTGKTSVTDRGRTHLMLRSRLLWSSSAYRGRDWKRRQPQLNTSGSRDLRILGNHLRLCAEQNQSVYLLMGQGEGLQDSRILETQLHAYLHPRSVCSAYAQWSVLQWADIRARGYMCVCACVGMCVRMRACVCVCVSVCV